MHKRGECRTCNGAGLIRTTETGFVPDICPLCARKARQAWEARQVRSLGQQINRTGAGALPQQREATNGR